MFDAIEKNDRRFKCLYFFGGKRFLTGYSLHSSWFFKINYALISE
jgi:hypothetical protein